MTNVIPLVDISPFLHGSDAERRAVAKAVNAACADIGFLLVSGHGIPASLIDRMRSFSTTFFDRPLKEKLRYRMPTDRYRGFIALGNEALAYSLDEKTPPDVKESFSIGPVDTPDDAYHRAAAPANFFAPNMWPEGLPEFRSTWTTYYRRMEELAATLMRIFAMALDMDEHYFDDKIDRHITNFSVLHYPPQDEAPLPGQLRAGAHTDYGSLTIVKPDGAEGGLQVLAKDGSWLDVPHVPEAVRGEPGRPHGRMDQRPLGLDLASGRQPVALRRCCRAAPLDGLLPSAQLRCGHPVPSQLRRPRATAALHDNDVGRACLDEDHQAPGPRARCGALTSQIGRRVMSDRA
jgi:isopenicillin N synthase-like dioxygenase